MNMDVDVIEGIKDYAIESIAYEGMHSKVLHATNKTTNERVYIKVKCCESTIY